MRIYHSIIKSAIILSLVTVAAVAQDQHEDRSAYGSEVIRAVAVITPTEGNDTTGTVTFTEAEGGTRIVAEVRNLTPGLHGFHVHEFGDCTAPDAASAGGHYNPTDMPHAGPDDEERHVGDFGNITAEEDGIGRYDRVLTGVPLDGEDSIIGRAVVIHRDADDLETQPAGDAGPRIGCGVIGIADTR